VDFRQKAPWSVQGAVDERVVKGQLCPLIADLGLPLQLHLALQRLKIPLNPVNADRKRVDQVEALSVFGQDRCERACNNVSDLRWSSTRPRQQTKTTNPTRSTLRSAWLLRQDSNLQSSG